MGKDNHPKTTQDMDPDDGQGLTLGLVPSPGHCEKVASRINAALPELLRDQTEHDVDWSIQVESDPLTGANVYIDEMLDAVASRKKRSGWDVAIALTDLPIREEGTTIVAEGRSAGRVAVLSVPALGIIRLNHSVKTRIAQLINDMDEKGDESDSQKIDIRMIARSAMGTIGLLGGMVYANRPWRLFPTFKTTVATAFATGGYGLIFTTLWQLGNLYGYDRLVTLMLVAMGILVSWIIIAHDLWETNKRDVTQYQRSLYNAATVATIASGVIFAYVIIFVLLLLAAFVYIPTPLLKSTIGTEVMPINYVRIAWITSSVATIAGAIGAGLEDSDAVRNATFGWRQITRWHEYNEEEKDDSDSS